MDNLGQSKPRLTARNDTAILTVCVVYPRLKSMFRSHAALNLFIFSSFVWGPILSILVYSASKEPFLWPPVFLFSLGIFLLFIAKWKNIRRGKFDIFGLKNLSFWQKRFYLFGYALIGAALLWLLIFLYLEWLIGPQIRSTYIGTGHGVAQYRVPTFLELYAVRLRQLIKNSHALSLKARVLIIFLLVWVSLSP